MKILSKVVLSEAPSAIFVDLDNTLYPYDPGHKAGLAAVGDKLKTNFDVQPEQFKALFDAARNSVKMRLGDAPSARSRLLYFQELLESIGLGAAVLKALDYEQTYWRTFLRHSYLFEGVTEFLDEARLRSIPVVLITNLTAQIQFQKLIYLGIEEAFDFVITSEQIGAEKPKPEIFHAAVAKVNCEPAKVWMIGDDLECDMAGSKQALDCLSFLKTNGSAPTKTRLANVDVTFDDFSKLTETLSKLEVTK